MSNFSKLMEYEVTATVRIYVKEAPFTHVNIAKKLRDQLVEILPPGTGVGDLQVMWSGPVVEDLK